MPQQVGIAAFHVLFRVNLAGKPPLHDNLAIGMHHVLIGIRDIDGHVDETGKFFHQQVAAVHQVVGTVAHGLAADNIRVEGSYLPRVIVHLPDGGINVTIYLGGYGGEALVTLLDGVRKAFPTGDDRLPRRIGIRVEREFLPAFPEFIHVAADGNFRRLVIYLLEHGVVFFARLPVGFLVCLGDNAGVEQLVPHAADALDIGTLSQLTGSLGPFKIRTVQGIECLYLHPLAAVAFRICI